MTACRTIGPSKYQVIAKAAIMSFVQFEPYKNTPPCQLDNQRILDGDLASLETTEKHSACLRRKTRMAYNRRLQRIASEQPRRL